MMRNDSTPDSFADSFRKLYQREIDRVFDDRFFTNETFYKHPIHYDFNFFDARVISNENWYIFLDIMTSNSSISINTTLK